MSVKLQRGQCLHCGGVFSDDKLKTKHVCRSCSKLLMKEWRARRAILRKANPEEYQRHLEYHRVKKREYARDPARIERQRQVARERYARIGKFKQSDPDFRKKQRQYAKEWRRRNPDKIKEYVDRKKAKVSEEQKKIRTKKYNKDSKARYGNYVYEVRKLKYRFDEEHRERIVLSAREYRLKNGERINQIKRSRYKNEQSYRERIKARLREKYQSDPEFRERVINRERERRRKAREAKQGAAAQA